MKYLYPETWCMISCITGSRYFLHVTHLLSDWRSENCLTQPSFFRYNEARQGPLGGTTFFEDTSINHVLKFLFEGLFMGTGNRIRSLVDQLQPWEKINVDLFGWVKTKESRIHQEVLCISPRWIEDHGTDLVLNVFGQWQLW